MAVNSTTTSGLFGMPTSTSSGLFGSVAAQPSGYTTSSLFNSSAQPKPSHLFGSSSAGGTGGTAFGSLFGGSAQTSSAGSGTQGGFSGLFGQPGSSQPTGFFNTVTPQGARHGVENTSGGTSLFGTAPGLGATEKKGTKQLCVFEAPGDLLGDRQARLQCITATDAVQQTKNLDELRWEDYQLAPSTTGGAGNTSGLFLFNTKLDEKKPEAMNVSTMGSSLFGTNVTGGSKSGSLFGSQPAQGSVGGSGCGGSLFGGTNNNTGLFGSSGGLGGTLSSGNVFTPSGGVGLGNQPGNPFNTVVGGGPTPQGTALGTGGSVSGSGGGLFGGSSFFPSSSSGVTSGWAGSTGLSGASGGGLFGNITKEGGLKEPMGGLGGEKSGGLFQGGGSGLCAGQNTTRGLAVGQVGNSLFGSTSGNGAGVGGVLGTSSGGSLLGQPTSLNSQGLFGGNAGFSSGSMPSVGGGKDIWKASVFSSGGMLSGSGNVGASWMNQAPQGSIFLGSQASRTHPLGGEAPVTLHPPSGCGPSYGMSAGPSREGEEGMMAPTVHYPLFLLGQDKSFPNVLTRYKTVALAQVWRSLPELSVGSRSKILTRVTPKRFCRPHYYVPHFTPQPSGGTPGKDERFAGDVGFRSAALGAARDVGLTPVSYVCGRDSASDPSRFGSVFRQVAFWDGDDPRPCRPEQTRRDAREHLRNCDTLTELKELEELQDKDPARLYELNKAPSPKGCCVDSCFVGLDSCGEGQEGKKNMVWEISLHPETPYDSDTLCGQPKCLERCPQKSMALMQYCSTAPGELLAEHGLSNRVGRLENGHVHPAYAVSGLASEPYTSHHIKTGFFTRRMGRLGLDSAASLTERCWKAPICTRQDYSTRPSLETLQCYSESRLATVEDFTVVREGFGEITWPGLTDVRGLNLDQVVLIEDKAVEVYPDVSHPNVGVVSYPPVGVGLNKPAIITLYNCGPHDSRTSDGPSGPPQTLYETHVGHSAELNLFFDQRLCDVPLL